MFVLPVSENVGVPLNNPLLLTLNQPGFACSENVNAVSLTSDAES